jgi:hypothetical protein
MQAPLAARREQPLGELQLAHYSISASWHAPHLARPAQPRQLDEDDRSVYQRSGAAVFRAAPSSKTSIARSHANSCMSLISQIQHMSHVIDF